MGEEISESLATQQHNDRPQSSGDKMRSKQPSVCQQWGVNYSTDSEDDKPTGEVADPKSKVNCYQLSFMKLIPSVDYFRKRILPLK